MNFKKLYNGIKKAIKNLTIRQRIYWSFALLVSLFVINAVITIITLNSNKKLSENITVVINPSLQAVEDFEDILVESKLYTTNWVFLRSNQQDKDALKKLHSTDYPNMRVRLNLLFSNLDNKPMTDSLHKVFTGFEALLGIEKKLMVSLQKFEDYDNFVKKFEAEGTIEDQLLPRTFMLLKSLSGIISNEQAIRDQKNEELERSSIRLRILISLLSITVIVVGILLSFYMAMVIINPVNKIKRIINDLGKGKIVRRLNNKISNDEIGEMFRSVENLSNKLNATAEFAKEVGLRNFDIPFEPLSNEDILGKAITVMRNNLKSVDQKLNEAQEIAHLGSWNWHLINDVLFWSDELFRIFGLDPATFVPNFESFLNLVHPGDRERVNGFITKCLQDQLPFSYECRIISSGGITKVIFARGKASINNKGEITELFGIAQDITSRKMSEANLEVKNKELQRKNIELEQFAYVASHDLQEPLSTTISYVQLFKRQYFGVIDSKADKCLIYIEQATDRMRILIKDLLDFSRIGYNKEIEPVDCNLLLKEVITDIDNAIKNCHAAITADYLPVISGYNTELKQLFQNLILNSIKFRKKNTRVKIDISVLKKGDYWQFAFKDNGIGIDPQHNERIFIIFQRLHNRTQYQGSGIGLSHCKKIVELHHGKIWVESIPGEGSTFYFTIPSPVEKTSELKNELHYVIDNDG